MLLVTLLLAAQTSHAAFVWSGGATPAEGAAALAHLDAQKKELATFMTFAPGYPKVVASADVQGMKPGFHVVILGVCPQGAAAELAIVKAFSGAAYAREVSVPAACPTLIGKANVVASRSTKKDDLVLTVSEIAVAREDGNDAGSMSTGSTRSEVVAVLRNKSGALVKMDVRQGDSAPPIEMFGTSCDGALVENKGGAVRFVAACKATILECGSNESRHTTAYEIHDGTLLVEETSKETKPHFCTQ